MCLKRDESMKDMMEKYCLSSRGVHYTDGAKYHWTKESMDFKESRLLGIDVTVHSEQQILFN